jgi:hypothetical protein
MFGPGIYFSDCVSKSINYTRNGKYRYLFLCEVALGNIKTMMKAERHDETTLEEAHSVMGVGRYGILKET